MADQSCLCISCNTISYVSIGLALAVLLAFCQCPWQSAPACQQVVCAICNEVASLLRYTSLQIVALLIISFPAMKCNAMQHIPDILAWLTCTIEVNVFP